MAAHCPLDRCGGSPLLQYLPRDYVVYICVIAGDAEVDEVIAGVTYEGVDENRF
jgi:hypothetical protein